MSKPSKSLIFRLSILGATFGTFALGTIAAPAAVSGQAAIAREFGNAPVVRTSEQKVETRMSAKDIAEAGVKLRAAIVETFDELGRGGKLSYTNNIKASITPYISAGMTFEESESVLRAAGFVVRPHPGAREEQDPNRSINWYAVQAEMPDFPRRIFGRIDVYVVLYPNSPGDYSTVKDVDAGIFVTTL